MGLAKAVIRRSENKTHVIVMKRRILNSFFMFDVRWPLDISAQRMALQPLGQTSSSKHFTRKDKNAFSTIFRRALPSRVQTLVGRVATNTRTHDLRDVSLSFVDDTPFPLQIVFRFSVACILRRVTDDPNGIWSYLLLTVPP